MAGEEEEDEEAKEDEEDTAKLRTEKRTLEGRFSTEPLTVCTTMQMFAER